MTKRLGVERSGDRVDTWWLHTGDDGNDRITIQTLQPSDPIIDAVKRAEDTPVDRKSSFRLKAKIPVTLIEEAARLKGAEWGLSVKDAFSEIVSGQTDRAKAVWSLLSQGRDYSKFQVRR